MGNWFDEQRKKKEENSRRRVEDKRTRVSVAKYLSERFIETRLSVDQLSVLSYPHLNDPLLTIHAYAKKLERGSLEFLPSFLCPRQEYRANMLKRVSVAVYWIDQCIGGGDEMNARITAVYPDFEPADLGLAIDKNI